MCTKLGAAGQHTRLWRAHSRFYSYIARVQYSMRHASSTAMLGHANVRKTCTTNSGHRIQAAVLLSIRRRALLRKSCSSLAAKVGCRPSQTQFVVEHASTASHAVEVVTEVVPLGEGLFVSVLLKPSHGGLSWLSAARCCQCSSRGTRLTAALSRIDTVLAR